MTTRKPAPRPITPKDLDRISLLTGWHKDPYDKRDSIRAFRMVGLPAEADLSPILDEAYDQGRVGSCVGNALALLLSGLAKAFKVYRGQFSRTWIYNGARFLEGELPYDVGCYPRSALKWLVQKGALPEALWPYDPTRLDKKSPPSHLEPEAAKWPVFSFERITGGALGISSALADGNLVALGCPWPDNWMATDPAGNLAKVQDSTPAAGGHEILLYGYDSIDQVFLFQNSWGADWGKAGRGRMPMASISFFNAQGGYDAHIVHVEWQAGPGPDPETPPDPKPKIPKTAIIITLAAALLAALALAIASC